MKVGHIGVLSLFVFACVAGTAQAGFQNPPARPDADKSQEEKRPDPPEAPSVKPGEEPKTPVAAVDPNTFQIGAEDILYIQVWREPDFTRQVMVRPDGKITLPLINDVEASGLTPKQLTETLTTKLGEFLKTPQVSVSVLQVNSKKYYVNGEVNRPGAFPLVVPTNVLQALTSAGGFREFANKKKIVILRKGETLKFNYEEVIRGKKPEQNILLQNGDFIIVK